MCSAREQVNLKQAQVVSCVILDNAVFRLDFFCAVCIFVINSDAVFAFVFDKPALEQSAFALHNAVNNTKICFFEVSLFHLSVEYF